MPMSKVYYLPQDRFDDVPRLLDGVSGKFIKENQFVALKIHFGEKGTKGYIRPEWTKPVVNYVKGKKAHPFLTDTNTIYRGQRADAVHHLMMAQGHGFKIEKVGAPVIIADGLRGNEWVDVPIEGKHYKSARIAKAIYDAHAMIVLSHTKGHLLTGYGGAIKNLGMGCAAKGAKYQMHASLYPVIEADNCVACGECIEWCNGNALALVGGRIALDKDKCVGCGECILACSCKAIDVPWDMAPAKVQERVAEYASAAVRNKPVCYVNYMHYITKNCDCIPVGADHPYLDNLGILVSSDPVAIDQASIDYINKAAGRDLFREFHPVDYNIQLIHAEKMGLGKRKYQLMGGD